MLKLPPRALNLPTEKGGGILETEIGGRSYLGLALGGCSERIRSVRDEGEGQEGMAGSKTVELQIATRKHQLRLAS